MRHAVFSAPVYGLSLLKASIRSIADDCLLLSRTRPNQVAYHDQLSRNADAKSENGDSFPRSQTSWVHEADELRWPTLAGEVKPKGRLR